MVRIKRRFVSLGLALLVPAGAVVALFASVEGPAAAGHRSAGFPGRRDQPAQDPTRAGPERTLTLEPFHVKAAPGGYRLIGNGHTNLPDGALITIEVAAAETVARVETSCQAGAIAIDSVHDGVVTNGTYRVLARFSIEDQPPAIREALHYQPRMLDATATLAVTDAVDPAVALRPRLLALIDGVNGGRDLSAVDEELSGLERGTWISTLKPAMAKLRSALDGARQGGVEKVRHALLEANVLAGL